MTSGVSQGIFPGAVLLIADNSGILFFKAYGFANIFNKRMMTVETCFDLASLTKPLATTLAVMTLVEEGKISPDQPVAEILEPFGSLSKAPITIRNLLLHNSGLPDYRPYYRELVQKKPSERITALNRFLAAEPLQAACGERVCYSDLGFMVLHWILETVLKMPLDQMLAEKIYGPLMLNSLGFIQNLRETAYPAAATEWCRYRGTLLEGRVQDENADVTGGVAGHAGLFGNALDIHGLLMALFRAYIGQNHDGPFCSRSVRLFFKLDTAAGRALGFDTPSKSGSSSGKWFSENSVGHLGFTGVSFWMDLKRGIWIILLTNRVHPDRRNQKIKAFRPVLHDMVMESYLRQAIKG